MEVKVSGTDSEAVRRMVKRITTLIPEFDPVPRIGSDGKVHSHTLTVREDGLREVVK